MDLLGGKYAQASDNIDAGKVKKVQVLERHQPIRALKDTKFSDQAALNIVLTDSAKNVWSHTFDLSTGASLTKVPTGFMTIASSQCCFRARCRA